MVPTAGWFARSTVDSIGFPRSERCSVGDTIRPTLCDLNCRWWARRRSEKSVYRLNFKKKRYAPIVRIIAPVLSWMGFKGIVRRAARAYASSYETSGELQKELLERTGCVPGSKVLEVGCGFLNAGIPIIRFLAADNYVGLDPNRWLVDAARGKRGVRTLMKEKRPRFLYVNTFDASELGIEFDFVISHSVLSHLCSLAIRSVSLCARKGSGAGGPYRGVAAIERREPGRGGFDV